MFDGNEVVSKASLASSWSVLPNGRLGLSLPALKCGKQVYVSTNLKTRLCEHGETASQISQWCAGQYERPPVCQCTCKNVDGLTAGRFSKLPNDWAGPPQYYEVLASSGAEEVTLPGGRVARRLSHIDGAFMLADGKIRCVHGNSECTLRAIEKSKVDGRVLNNFRRPCGCRIGARPWRATRLQTAGLGKRFL